MLQLVLTPGPPGVLRQPRWRPPVQSLSEAGPLIGAALGSVAGVVVDPALPPGCRARICVGDTAELLRRCAASKGAERERTRTQRGRHQEHLRHSPNSSDAQFLWGWGSGSGGGAVQSGMLLPTPWHPRDGRMTATSRLPQTRVPCSGLRSPPSMLAEGRVRAISRRS